MPDAGNRRLTQMSYSFDSPAGVWDYPTNDIDGRREEKSRASGGRSWGCIRL